MSGNYKFVYSDTCIFIDWFSSKPQRTPQEMAGIEEQVQSFKQGKLFISTCALTLTELLESQMTEQGRTKFNDLRHNRNYRLISVDGRIAKLAGELRDYYSKVKDEVSATLTTPDAIHLSAAIISKCEAFYTFDGKDRIGKNRALLPLDGILAGRYSLRIIKPEPNPNYQMKLI